MLQLVELITSWERAADALLGGEKLLLGTLERLLRVGDGTGDALEEVLDLAGEAKWVGLNGVGSVDGDALSGGGDVDEPAELESLIGYADADLEPAELA